VRSENGAGLACEAIEHILKGGAGG
jgi:hypothetical protein